MGRKKVYGLPVLVIWVVLFYYGGGDVDRVGEGLVVTTRKMGEGSWISRQVSPR